MLFELEANVFSTSKGVYKLENWTQNVGLLNISTRGKYEYYLTDNISKAKIHDGHKWYTNNADLNGIRRSEL